MQLIYTCTVGAFWCSYMKPPFLGDTCLSKRNDGPTSHMVSVGFRRQIPRSDQFVPSEFACPPDVQATTNFNNGNWHIFSSLIYLSTVETSHKVVKELRAKGHASGYFTTAKSTSQHEKTPPSFTDMQFSTFDVEMVQ